MPAQQPYMDDDGSDEPSPGLRAADMGGSGERSNAYAAEACDDDNTVTVRNAVAVEWRSGPQRRAVACARGQCGQRPKVSPIHKCIMEHAGLPWTPGGAGQIQTGQLRG